MCQLSTIPVDIPQYYHLRSHLTTQWWILSQIHHIHQVTLPIDIHPHSHQNKNKINSLTLSPQHNIPHIYHHHFLWILLMLPVFFPVSYQILVPVPFQVLFPHSCSICNTKPFTFSTLSLTFIYSRHSIFFLQLIINFNFKIIIWTHKFRHPLTPKIDSIHN